MTPLLASDLSGSDLAAIIVAIASVVAVVLLVLALISVTRTLTVLRLAIEDLRRQTLPVVQELQQTVANANAELARVDTLMDSAQSLTTTVDSASRLAYLAFSNPVIKVIALASGTARAGRALRRRD